jgi:hypothetical protein
MKSVVVGLAATLGLAMATAAVAQNAPKIGDPADAKNMALVGYSDLQARSAYQPVIQHQGSRWIAYIGHHGGTDEIKQPFNPLTGKNEDNGTSIVDVTDPHHPKYLTHIPGEPGTYEAGGAQMVRVCDGKQLPKGDRNTVYMLRVFGNQAHEIWNVTEPERPKMITRVVEGLKGTHKSFWECETGIAYLVSGVPGWRVPRMTQIYDLSDPAHPVHIRDFGLPGQQPGSSGPTPIMLHGMISVPSINRIYFGYGTNTDGIVQIVDREKLLKGPKEPTDENLRYPEVSRWEMSPFNGAHTVFPMLNIPIQEFADDKLGRVRNFVVVTDEQIQNECLEPRQMVWFVDITVEKRPVSVATYGAKEEPGNFCARGGRFGTHSSNENMTPIYYGRLMFFAHFNGGVRAVDVRDPYHPREVGHYIPAITKNTDKRCIKLENGEQRCKVAIQTNNLEVDDRGYIYAVDRANTGLHILQVTGEARKIANFPRKEARTE